jgi:hypothetical protein
MEAHDLDNESRWDDEEKKERELAELKRLLAEKNETANTFMEQVKKLQARVFELESNNRYQRGYAAGEKDGADEARKNYTLAHANLGREVVENGNLQAQLREAIAIIDDMVNSLDGADYDRARKFLKFPVPENRPVRVPLNFTFCARCGEQMKPNDASAEASNAQAEPPPTKIYAHQ